MTTKAKNKKRDGWITRKWGLKVVRQCKELSDTSEKQNKESFKVELFKFPKRL